MALDKDAPLRYKTLCLYPDGVANALFSTLSQSTDERHVLADMFQSNMVLKWISWQENAPKYYTDMITKFDKCRMFLRNPKAGYGIERCLYFLDKSARCLSPLFEKFIVRDIDSMMDAFETLAEKNAITHTFFDSHVSAFLSIHASKLIEGSLYDLDSSDETQKMLGQLCIFSHIQPKTAKKLYPHIARIFLKHEKTLFSNFKDTKRVEKLSAKLEKAASNGDLVAMYAIATNAADVKNDKAQYDYARAQYKVLNSENMLLEKSLDDNAQRYKHHAQHITGLLACGIGFILIVIIAIVKLTSEISGF